MAKKNTKVTAPVVTSEEKVVTWEEVLTMAKDKGYPGIESMYELQAWVRVKFSLHPEIFYSMFHKKFSINNYFVNVAKGSKVNWDYKPINYESYDDALLVALYNMLLLV